MVLFCKTRPVRRSIIRNDPPHIGDRSNGGIQMTIPFERTKNPKQKPARAADIPFGHILSDHLFQMRCNDEAGWHDAAIRPYADLRLSPAATCLHYGQEVFEGLKAYRRQDGRIHLFRTADHLRRMNRSANRLAMPQFDEDLVRDALHRLVRIEESWIPSENGTSLYIRPNYIGTGSTLGVRRASEYLFYIVCGPAGAYYRNGLQPVRILIEETYTRAAKGGMGAAKTGGNYAASLAAGAEACRQGCDQVLWLDAAERLYVQEAGSMNIMFVLNDRLVTPPLTCGTILAGITRDSVLQLARDRNIPVDERDVTVDELTDAAHTGALTEAFGTGTAAVISPIGSFVRNGQTIPVSDGRPGPVTRMFYDTLTGIQYGRIPDPYGWTDPLTEP